MPFILKKYLSFWLMPLPLCLGLLVLGTLLIWSKKHIHTGKYIISFSLLVFLLLSNTTISTWLILPLEYKYSAIPALKSETLPYALKRCQFIVILGSSNSEDKDRSALNRLSGTGLSRLTEAVRLANLLPDAHLIATGPGYNNHQSHASVLAEGAVELQIQKNRILKIDTAKDTEEESIAIHKIVGDRPIALVTTAWHMPRAVFLFKSRGMDVLPCPTDFTIKNTSENNHFELNQINASWSRSTWAIHEYLGILWIEVRSHFI